MADENQNPYRPPPPSADAPPVTIRQLPLGQMHFIGFWRRLGARAIDLTAWTAQLVVLLALLDQIISDAALRLTVFNTVAGVAFALYFIVVQGWRGQTLGKLATRIQVRLVDGTPLTYKAAVWRYSPELVLSVLGIVLTHHTIGEGAWDQSYVSPGLSFAWYLAEVFVLTGSTKSRAIHDLIAGTVVVRKPARIAATGELGGPELPAQADEPEDVGDVDPLEDRVLCPDGACIGVIGQDGLCKACGRAADWQP